MKTGILFATNHGSCQKVAEIIQQKIGLDDVELVNLKKDKNPDIDKYDTIILGGSIHAGKIQNVVRNFYQKNIILLKEKKLALYLCCMMEKDALKQFDEAFTPEIRELSVSNKIVGGEFIFENMNFIERAITKKIVKIDKSVSKLKYDEIDELIRELN